MTGPLTRSVHGSRLVVAKTFVNPAVLLEHVTGELDRRGLEATTEVYARNSAAGVP